MMRIQATTGIVDPLASISVSFIVALQAKPSCCSKVLEFEWSTGRDYRYSLSDVSVRVIVTIISSPSHIRTRANRTHGFSSCSDSSRLSRAIPRLPVLIRPSISPLSTYDRAVIGPLKFLSVAISLLALTGISGILRKDFCGNLALPPRLTPAKGKSWTRSCGTQVPMDASQPYRRGSRCSLPILGRADDMHDWLPPFQNIHYIFCLPSDWKNQMHTGLCYQLTTSGTHHFVYCAILSADPWSIFLAQDQKRLSLVSCLRVSDSPGRAYISFARSLIFCGRAIS